MLRLLRQHDIYRLIEAAELHCSGGVNMIFKIPSVGQAQCSRVYCHVYLDILSNWNTAIRGDPKNIFHLGIIEESS